MSPIDGFVVYYKEYDSAGPFRQQIVQGKTTRVCTISGLRPNTDYVVQIASYNSAGQGPISVDAVDRTLGQRTYSMCGARS